ncbi:murein hydrolase transporter LrgA [Marinobacterium zhoushanense]|uniref:Murein hydrolase transporter LrgA n=1 Tax=Marinobacterium zhoushanense TaxID=1679163 RepID=A0ABQ1K7C2_9GAMM|nr:CidA/LrgA family protein [Marinobacterium zhoushanense]GGB87887.1 murein hydrolase transporter LrgA [Marinobacterium zhoushanense]
MLLGLLILLGCQLIGELLVVALGLPVPGPVVGMLLLLSLLLLTGRRVPEALRKVVDGLLGHLALLFVPAGVGLMNHFGLLAREWVMLAVTLVVSTAITMAVTGWLMSRLARRFSAKEEL